MTSNNNDFDALINREFGDPDPTPYGTPAPARPGLTARGRIALAAGAALVLGGATLAGIDYLGDQAERDLKAQEIALKFKQLELEAMKEQNKAGQALRKQQEEDTDRRRECVENLSEQVNSSFQIASSCTELFPTSDTHLGAAPAGQNDTSEGGTSALLVGGAALAGLVAWGARSRRKDA